MGSGNELRAPDRPLRGPFPPVGKKRDPFVGRRRKGVLRAALGELGTNLRSTQANPAHKAKSHFVVWSATHIPISLAPFHHTGALLLRRCSRKGEEVRAVVVLHEAHCAAGNKSICVHEHTHTYGRILCRDAVLPTSTSSATPFSLHQLPAVARLTPPFLLAAPLRYLS